MSDRPITEQAILATLQAIATNPDYFDIMRTMEQHWSGLRTITLLHITIPNVPKPSLNSIPHDNPATDQPGHPQYGTSERNRTPLRDSSSSQRVGGGERRPESRKRKRAPQLDL